MKQILFVLAILISGIASAQSELYTVSRCGGGAVDRYISVNDLDYVLVGDYVNVVNAANLVCLSNDGNISRNWMTYYENYLGATIVDNTNHNHWTITFSAYPNIEMQRRTNGQYRVYRQDDGNRIINGRNFFGNTAPRTAYEFAFNGNPPN